MARISATSPVIATIKQSAVNLHSITIRESAVSWMTSSAIIWKLVAKLTPVMVLAAQLTSSSVIKGAMVWTIATKMVTATTQRSAARVPVSIKIHFSAVRKLKSSGKINQSAAITIQLYKAIAARSLSGNAI